MPRNRGFVVPGTFPVDFGYKRARSNRRDPNGPLIQGLPRTKRTMKNAPFLHRFVLFALVLLPWTGAVAQQAVSHERVTMQVEGLTSATRDALAKDLKRTDEIRLVFACVPAGILVLESRTGHSRGQLEERGRTALTARNASLRTRTIGHDLAAAEMACEQARNR